ncbi:MAG: hypothetical protein DSO04_03070 [Hadesarchaea archaeon]|nr:MAG: hypothetical protein DSO04_03070 [Hadesarchaea archaeon]
MPLVLTKEWFESIRDAWNSDPSNIKSLEGVNEKVLWIVEELPLSKLPPEMEKAILEEGMIDEALFRRAKEKDRVELLLEWKDGRLVDFRPARGGEEYTARMRGKYSVFERIKTEEDFLWASMDREIDFRGRLFEFTRRLDGYTKFTLIMVSKTDLI